MSRSLFAFAPTIGWTLLMVLPFLYMNFWFPEGPRGTQGLGIALTYLALFLSDSYFSRKQLHFKCVLTRGVWLSIGIFSFFLIVFVSLFHVMSMPEIPFVGLLNGTEGKDFEQLREQAWKNLAVPELVKYLFQWVPNVFFPITLAIFFHLRKWIWSGFAIFLMAAYSVTTGVKLIPVLTLIVVLMYFYLLFSPKSRRLVFRLSLGVITFTGILVALNLTFNPDSLFHASSDKGLTAQQVTTDFWTQTPLDIFRWQITHGKEYKDVSAITKASNFIAYRIFLVPVEVSQRWYAFYPRIKGEHMGLYGLNPKDRQSENFVNLSREVGLWAYYSRYEGKIFGPTISANASMDADLWARGGFLGLLLVPLLVFGMRACLFFLSVWDEPFRFVSRFALFLYSMLLPMASFQAILLPHGFFVYAILGLMGLCMYWRMQRNEARN